MFKFLRQTFRRETQGPAPFSAAISPTRPVYVIGDVHGRDDLLGPLLEKIANVAAGAPHDLVTVGDYVDRGENSGAVLRRLKDLSDKPNVTCLMGNHERLLLDFIDDPAENGRRWIRNGGLQTLASFGVGGLTETGGNLVMANGRDALLKALGALEPWLRALPLSFESGNLAVVHAGADPQLPISDQPEKNLIWGHPAFFKIPRDDGIWVAHGHTITATAHSKAGRINVDTGAYATGQLTAAAIAENRETTFL